MQNSSHTDERHLSDPERLREDLELARGVLGKQEAAIERFAERSKCIPRILATQNARLGRPLNEHDIADLAQDTLIVVWCKLDEFEGRAALESWVYRICYLELMNAIRKKKRLPHLVEELPELASAAHRERPAPHECEDIYRGFEILEAQEVNVIRLKHFDELTFDEVAARLEISANTAKTRYYRGLSKLHDFLRNRNEDGRESLAR